MYLPFCGHCPWRWNENSTHVKNHGFVGAASRPRPSPGSLVPALVVFQEVCPPSPLDTGLEKPPYAHGEAKAIGLTGRVEPCSQRPRRPSFPTSFRDPVGEAQAQAQARPHPNQSERALACARATLRVSDGGREAEVEVVVARWVARGAAAAAAAAAEAAAAALRWWRRSPLRAARPLGSRPSLSRARRGPRRPAPAL